MEYSTDLKNFISYRDLAQVGGSHPLENKKLADIILQEKPNIVMETGVFVGSSTVIILEALKQLNNGMLYSVDNLLSINKWTGCYVTEDLKSRWNFIKDRSDNYFKMLPDNFAIDIFLHDSEHTEINMEAEFLFAFKHVKSHGWILSHDINNNEAWKNFTESIKDNIIDSFHIENLAGVKIRK